MIAAFAAALSGALSTPAFGNGYGSNLTDSESWMASIEATTVVTSLLIGALLARLAYLLPKQSALASEVETLQHDRQTRGQLEAAIEAERDRGRLLVQQWNGPVLWVDDRGILAAASRSLDDLLHRAVSKRSGEPAETVLNIRLVDEQGRLDPSKHWVESLRSYLSLSGEPSFSSSAVLLKGAQGGSVSLKLCLSPIDLQAPSRDVLIQVEEGHPGIYDSPISQRLALQYEGLRWLASDFAGDLEETFDRLRNELLTPEREKAGDQAASFGSDTLLKTIRSGERAAGQFSSFVVEPRPSDGLSPEDHAPDGRAPAGRVSVPAGELLDQALEDFSALSVLREVPADLPPAFVDTRRTAFVIRSILVTCQGLMEPEDRLSVSARLVKATGRLDDFADSRGPVDNLSSRDRLRNTSDHLQMVLEGVSGYLDKTQISALFFSTLPSSPSQELGVGFAAAKEIMRRQKGSFAVSSSAESGTRFTLTLPVGTPRVSRTQEASAGNGRQPESAASGPSQPTPKSGKPSESSGRERGRVLVMDDEQSILALLSAALRRLGFDPVTTKSGEEAVAAAEDALGADQPFCLAILDLTIPGGMGGVDTASHLGRLQPDMILVASSGYAQNPALIDFKNFGFDEALVKPYRIPDLSKLLDRLLSRQA